MKQLLLILFSYFPFIVSAQLSPNSIQTSHGRIGFYQFKPAGYNADSTYEYPLIIFMHGVGERGDGSTQLPRVLLQAFPKLIAEGASMKFVINDKPEAFIVLMPQMSMEYENWQAFYIDEMISFAKSNFKVNTNKIFITGWSLGGGGAWKYPTSSVSIARQVAGIILAAPSPDYTDLCNLATGHVAVWAFHAKDDASVPIHFTEDAVEGINKCGPEIPALMTYYKAGGHPFTAEAVYDTLNRFQYPNIFQWMAGVSKTNTRANNQPPLVEPGEDFVLEASKPLVLDGSRSRDPNDVIVQYRWKLVSGPPSPTLHLRRPDYPVTEVSGYELGDYIFNLTVTDEFNVSRSKNVQVSIRLPKGHNAPPLAFAGKDLTVSSSTCYLLGRGRDYDGRVTRYHWRQLSGPARLRFDVMNMIAAVSNLSTDGKYLVEMTAEDDAVPSGTARDTITITRKLSIPAYFIAWTRGQVITSGKWPVSYGMAITSFILLCVYSDHFRLKTKFPTEGQQGI